MVISIICARYVVTAGKGSILAVVPESCCGVEFGSTTLESLFGLRSKSPVGSKSKIAKVTGESAKNVMESRRGRTRIKHEASG